MPLLTTQGSLSARAAGFTAGASYNKPSMLTLGSGAGTVTSNAAGYALSGFADTKFAYLDASKSSGKWYWESTYVSAYLLHGVASDVTTAQSYGGYSSYNAGVYTNGPTLWIQSLSPWSGTSVGAGWSGGTFSGGDVIGFALDMDSATRTLKIYQNNSLSATLSWTSSQALWPMFAFQSSPSTQVKLGPGNTSYSPPSGYSYI